MSSLPKEFLEGCDFSKNCQGVGDRRWVSRKGAKEEAEHPGRQLLDAAFHTAYCIQSLLQAEGKLRHKGKN